MASKKTFYIVSDNIQTKAKDKARISAVAEAFKSLGHKAVKGKVSSNAHTKPTDYKKSFGKNDVWVTIFGGVCGGTIADMTGYTGFGNWFKNDELKKGSLFVIWVSSPEGASINVKTAKKLPKAHDDNFSPKSFNGIPNPVSYLKKKGVTWIEAGTTEQIVNLIKAQNWEGSGFDIDSDSSTKTVENSYSIYRGFDTNTHFEGYLQIDYSVNDPKGKTKTILVDWSAEAPSKDGNKFDNKYNFQWENRKKAIHQINLLDKVRSAESNYGGLKDDKYYLRRVLFRRDFQDVYDDKDTEEKENLLYDKNERSTYKMLLYDIGVFRGESANMESLGLGGKTLLDGMKTILEKSKYGFKITYGNRREADYLTFVEETDLHTTQYIFNEGYDGNVIGVSNVKYSPTSQLMNSSIIIYKSNNAENDKTATYSYARKSKLGEVLRYGEQQKVENTSEDTGSAEARQKAYDNLMEYFQPITTFTVKSVGLPPVEIGDWVETEMVNPLLSNEYQVASRKINIDVNDRPMVQTEFGLGDIDALLKVKNNLSQQRKAIVRRQLDVSNAVAYYDENDWDNTLWVD